MTTLHITNGDGAAGLIKASAVAGDVLPWRDPMHHGPMPAGHDLRALSETRARYLAGPESDPSQALRDFRLRDDHALAASGYANVVLWFEHDLLDQLQILQILDLLARLDPAPGSLEMICIDTFPGITPFRGIGELDPVQTAQLFDLREPVTDAQHELAGAGWVAFRSADPRDLERFAAGDLGALPFLRAALIRHLEEYPWLDDGLTRTERQILSLVAEGVRDPVEVFVHNMEREAVLYIGDWTTFGHIARLCGDARPLITTASGQPFWYPAGSKDRLADFRAQGLQITRTGRDVLSGDADAFDALPRDHWLGGVHLVSGPGLWVWNPARGALQQRRA